MAKKTQPKVAEPGDRVSMVVSLPIDDAQMLLLMLREKMGFTQTLAGGDNLVRGDGSRVSLV